MRAAVAALLCGVASAAAPRPNIIHMLLDDFGWAEVGFHRTAGADSRPAAALAPADVSTPVLDSLVAESLELRRFYVHKICSPTRCSLQSGRAPIHVNVVNVLPESTNPEDPVGGYQGIPINMTTMAQLLSRAGYRTAAVGKWDVGMATPRHSPLARGYQSWLGYWHHSNVSCCRRSAECSHALSIVCLLLLTRQRWLCCAGLLGADGGGVQRPPRARSLAHQLHIQRAGDRACQRSRLHR